MTTFTKSTVGRFAAGILLALLVVTSTASAAGNDLRQFNEFINQGLRQMQIPGVNSHNQLPEGVRRAIHDALARAKARGATVDAATVIEHLGEWQETIRRGATGLGRGSRAVRIAKRAAKGGFGVGIGVVLVTGTAWAGGEQPSATDLAGALPIVGIPVTVYAVADELISAEVARALAELECNERAMRYGDALRWNLAIALVNHGIRSVGQMCLPSSESSPPPCREIRPKQLVDCLDQQLERANSLAVIDRPLNEKMQIIDAGVRACFEAAITFETASE